MLEQLGARFELVLEAVTGFGGRVEALRGEINGQFAEVGRQVRFISDRIAENREANAVTRADLGAEMIRLGEMLGATRIEFREQLGSIRHDLGQGTETVATQIREAMVEEMGRRTNELDLLLRSQIAAAGEALRTELRAARGQLGRDQSGKDLPAAAEDKRGEISSATETLIKKIDSELKQANKALAGLARKFERFDDRVTVQARDQDQRLRKLERKTSAR
jgi:hypothetical protein